MFCASEVGEKWWMSGYNSCLTSKAAVIVNKINRRMWNVSICSRCFCFPFIFTAFCNYMPLFRSNCNTAHTLRGQDESILTPILWRQVHLIMNLLVLHWRHKKSVTVPNSEIMTRFDYFYMFLYVSKYCRWKVCDVQQWRPRRQLSQRRIRDHRHINSNKKSKWVS